MTIQKIVIFLLLVPILPLHGAQNTSEKKTALSAQIPTSAADLKKTPSMTPHDIVEDLRKASEEDPPQYADDFKMLLRQQQEVQYHKRPAWIAASIFAGLMVLAAWAIFQKSRPASLKLK